MRRAFAALLLVVGVLLLSSAEALAQDAKARRFAVAVFHFNVQYCAGGLEDFRDDLDLGEVWAGLDATAEGVEDAIIEESFHPLLELFAAHPTWSADFEMQGLMVERCCRPHGGADCYAQAHRLVYAVGWGGY